MTQSEKNTKQSEIYLAKSIDLVNNPLHAISNVMFCMLDGHQFSTIITPASGYWNLLLFQESLPLELEFTDQTEEISLKKPLFRAFNQGELLKIRSKDPSNKALLLFIPKQEIPTEMQSASLLKDYEQTAKNDQDARFLLKLATIQELSLPSDYISQLKLQAAIIDIFSYQMEKIGLQNKQSVSDTKKNHFEKIQLVKNLIDADFSINHTIPELAKEVGTNEQYLKKYFKLYFGKTVMSYITQVKMEYAKKLILEGKYRIADIATMTGYKHATHFTTAFKKYFGIIPNSLRYTLLTFPLGAPYLVESLQFLLF